MEIILKEDIIGLGYKNDIVKVKNGYGRNYLIPTGKGIVASEQAKKVLAENLKQQAAKLAVIKAEAEKKGAALEGVELTIAAKVSSTGVTYGSVNTAAVAAELKARGFDIDRKIITMKDIKTLGKYEATIHFHKEVEIKVPVTVVADEGPETPAVEEETALTEEKAPLTEEIPAEEPVLENERPAEVEAAPEVAETAPEEETVRTEETPAAGTEEEAAGEEQPAEEAE